MNSFQAYMTEALTEAGLTDTEVTSALNKLYSNDKLSPKLNQIVKVATEDYQAQVGRVQALEKEKITRDKEVNDWYTKTNAEYQRVMKELQDKNNNPNDPPAFDASKYVSKEDLQKTVEDLGNRWASVVKDATSITAEHVTRFNERPDLDAIEKIAQDQHLPIRAAYEKYIEPKVKEQEEKGRKDWEAKTRTEIEQDVRSRFKLPVDPKPNESAPIYAQVDRSKVPADMDAELLSTWNGVGNK